MKKLLKILLSFLVVFTMIPLASASAETKKPDVRLWNVVKPLGTTVTFLNTGAHPDDERSDFLAYLSRGLGVKTASLIANRGEGGQNEIGPELGNGLGIIRSREMIEAAKITGVKAYHLSETTSDAIYDFGFSKSPEDTLANWGEDLTYERFIRFIRTYQPDIVMPSFRNVDSQHGHHRAIEMLSERAFKDAADPTVFPKQLKEGLSVWQIKKLYLPAETKEQTETSIEIGMVDPKYQISYPQLGEQSRYMHKSQGMGSNIPVEPRQVNLELLYSAVGNDPELFAGVPYNFTEWAQLLPKNEQGLKVQLTQFQKELDSIISVYPSDEKVFTRAQTALKTVRNLVKKTEKSKLDPSSKKDLIHKLSIKEQQLQEASFVASKLEVKAVAGADVLTKGQRTTVTVTLKNNGKYTLQALGIQLAVPKGWKTSTKNKTINLKPGKSTKYVYQVSVPANADFYHPYKDPVIQTVIGYQSAGTKVTQVQELEGTVAVLPDVSLTLAPEDIVVNTVAVQKEIPVKVKVKNYRQGALTSKVSLKVPAGWTVSPKQTSVTLSKQTEVKDVTFKLKPPKTIGEGSFSIEAEAVVNGRSFTSTIQEISYDHIGQFYYEYPAKVNVAAFELQKKDQMKIGYIDSGFDQVADYLINAGLPITKLSEADVKTGDLRKFDTIVVGIRAYLSRKDLLENNNRLKEYVYNGGHVVMQYHKPTGDNWNAQTSAPYPLTIGNPSIKWRVTDENAKVTVLKPDSELFNFPNKITDKDWDNWIQERGLYYPMEWDPQYETFVRMGDPGEQPFDGGILLTKYGKGTYLYTNLVFYRQIQGLVPGGYRIFTNLISYGVQN